MLRTLRNLLLMEALVAAVFVGIIATVLLNRLAYYQEAAEKATMELTISSIKSALRMRMATMMIEGRTSQYASLAQENPMDWLEQKPANYAGLVPAHPHPETLAGNWVFDPASRDLIYWVKHGEHFQADSSGERKVSLRLKLLSERPASESEAKILITGARIELGKTYKWF